MEPCRDEGTPMAVADEVGVNVLEVVAAGVDVEDTSFGGAGEMVADRGTGEDVTVDGANVEVGSALAIGIDALQALKYSKTKLKPITHRGHL